MADFWDTLVQTAGDIGKTAINVVGNTKQAKAQAELVTEQAIETKQSNKEFWQKFAIVSGAIVGGLILGKIFKLI